MVSEAETLKCEFCSIPTLTPKYTIIYSLASACWKSCMICDNCYSAGYSIGLVDVFDTKEERDLWLIKQRI